jgi:hypothetical protein
MPLKPDPATQDTLLILAVAAVAGIITSSARMLTENEPVPIRTVLGSILFGAVSATVSGIIALEVLTISALLTIAIGSIAGFFGQTMFLFAARWAGKQTGVDVSTDINEMHRRNRWQRGDRGQDNGNYGGYGGGSENGPPAGGWQPEGGDDGESR